MSSKPTIIAYSEEHDCLTEAKWNNEEKAYLHIKPVKGQMVQAQQVLNAFRQMAKSTNKAVKAQQSAQKKFEDDTHALENSFFTEVRITTRGNSIKFETDDMTLSKNADTAIDQILEMIPEDQKKRAEMYILDLIDSAVNGAGDAVNRLMSKTAKHINDEVA